MGLIKGLIVKRKRNRQGKRANRLKSLKEPMSQLKSPVSLQRNENMADWENQGTLERISVSVVLEKEMKTKKNETISNSKDQNERTKLATDLI